MIRVDRLAVRIGATGRLLVDQLDLHLNTGQVMAVLGPNGRGKTTLLRTLLGLLPVAAGQVHLGGHTAYVPQQMESMFPYTVLNMVMMGRARHLRWWQSPKSDDLDAALASLEEVELSALAQQSFHALSGGQKQLVYIARAIASASPIVVLDEPMAALDLRNQNLILRILQRLAQQKKLCIVFSTHQPQHALQVADQTLLMYPEGCEVGSTAQMCQAERLSRVYQLPVNVVTTKRANGSAVTGIIPLFEQSMELIN